MKPYTIVQNMMAMILLSTMSSCGPLPKADSSLTGQIYVNEQTQHKIEFTKKGTVVITWVPDEEDYPHEFSYAVRDAGRKIQLRGLSSSEALRFPYKTMEISDSKDKIIATRYDGRKELFMKIVSTDDH